VPRRFEPVHPAWQEQVLQDDRRPPLREALEQFLAARCHSDDLQVCE